MPLPCITKHGAKRCAALSKRTKLACGNPAAYGCKTCRFHGARKNILRGEHHPSYVHGKRTLEAERQSSASSLRLANLEDAMHLLQMTTASRSRGRKPTGYRRAVSIDELEI